MSDQVYSPSVAAALANSPKHAEVARAQAKVAVPHPASADAAELVTTVAQPALQQPVHVPDNRREIFENVVNAQSDWDLKRVGLSRAALLAGQTLEHAAQPDAIESALVRIDALDERAVRYRNAVGGQRRLSEPGEPISCKIEPTKIREIEMLAQQRGEKRSETMRWLIESGLVLADERRKRYEAFMLGQMRDRLGAFGGTADEKRTLLAEIDPQRYVDPDSPSLQHAMREVDPFGGAPAEVRAVLESGHDDYIDAVAVAATVEKPWYELEDDVFALPHTPTEAEAVDIGRPAQPKKLWGY